MKIVLMFLLVFCCGFSIAYAKPKNSNDHSDESWAKCLCSRGANAVTSTTRKITLKQAKALVMMALTARAKRMPGVTINMPDDDSEDIDSYLSNGNPRFLEFNVAWAATEGSDLVGWYSVDIYTGYVFDSVAGCAEHKNKKLGTLQKKVRQSLHLTTKQYQHLKTAGPMCTPDDPA